YRWCLVSGPPRPSTFRYGPATIKQLVGDLLHRLSEALHIEHDVTGRYVPAVSMVEQPLQRVGRQIQAFCNRDERAAQIVKGEFHFGPLRNRTEPFFRLYDMPGRVVTAEYPFAIGISCTPIRQKVHQKIGQGQNKRIPIFRLWNGKRSALEVDIAPT